MEVGNEAINISAFQKNIEGMADFMWRMIHYTKGCGNVSINDILFDDNQFSAVKAEEDSYTEVKGYFGPVNKICKGF